MHNGGETRPLTLAAAGSYLIKFSSLFLDMSNFEVDEHLSQMTW